MKITKQQLQQIIQEELQSLQADPFEDKYDENLLQENPAAILAVLKNPKVIMTIVNILSALPAVLDMVKEAGVDAPKLEAFAGKAQSVLGVLEPVLGALNKGDE